MEERKRDITRSRKVNIRKVKKHQNFISHFLKFDDKGCNPSACILQRLAPLQSAKSYLKDIKESITMHI